MTRPPEKYQAAKDWNLGVAASLSGVRYSVGEDNPHWFAGWRWAKGNEHIMKARNEYLVSAGYEQLATIVLSEKKET